MDLLRSIELFVRVAELGSFSRAAERLAISNAAATRHVAHLESVFGGRLFDRTTRKLRLTQAGRACLDHCRRVMHEVEGAEHAVREITAEPRGTLRVVSTSLFWMREISPRLPEFLREYPGITLHVNLTEKQPDLLGDDYDVSLQFQPPTGQTMIVRRIRTLNRVVCAAPDYIERNGTPTSLEALSGHNCLLYASSDEAVVWRFHLHGEEVRFSPSGNLRSNDAWTLRDAAVAGIGIVRSPHFIIEDDLAAGRLVPLLPDAISIDPDFYAIFPSRKLVPARLRLFLDFLQRNFADDGWSPNKTRSPRESFPGWREAG